MSFRLGQIWESFNNWRQHGEWLNDEAFFYEHAEPDDIAEYEQSFFGDEDDSAHDYDDSDDVDGDLLGEHEGADDW